MTSVFDALLVVPGVRALPGSDKEVLRQALQRLEGSAGREEATAVGGGTRSRTISRLVVSGDLDVMTGVVRIGPTAVGKGNIILTGGGIQLRTNTTTKIDLQSDGDIFIGEDTSAAGTTYFSIFVNAQTYNTESMSAGDMLIGDNSSSKANILWDKSAGELLFRGGQTSNVKINTNGAIVLEQGSAASNSINWELSGTVRASINTDSSGSVSILTVSAGITGTNGNVELRARSTGSGLTSAGIFLTGSTGEIAISTGTGAGTGAVTLSSSNLIIENGQWLGLGAAKGRFTFTDAAADTIAVNIADLLIDTGRYVGIGASAGRLVFTDAAADTIGVVGADLLIDTTRYVGLGSAAGRIIFTDAGTDTIELATANVSVSGGSLSVASPNSITADAGTITAGTLGTTAGDLVANQFDSGTTTVLSGLSLGRYTSGTAAAGLGVQVLFRLESDGNASRTTGRIVSEWIVATDASRTSRMRFNTEDSAGTREGLRIESDGSVPRIGFYGVTAVVRASAYTQTYSTSSKTVANITATDPAAYGAGANGYSTGAMAQAVHAEVIALKADLTVVKNNITAIIDDLQAYGLMQ